MVSPPAAFVVLRGASSLPLDGHQGKLGGWLMYQFQPTARRLTRLSLPLGRCSLGMTSTHRHCWHSIDYFDVRFSHLRRQWLGLQGKVGRSSCRDERLCYSRRQDDFFDRSAGFQKSIACCRPRIGNAAIHLIEPRLSEGRHSSSVFSVCWASRFMIIASRILLLAWRTVDSSYVTFVRLGRLRMYLEFLPNDLHARCA